MLQFTKLISIISFMTILYSIPKMHSAEEFVFYMAILVVSMSVFLLSVGILATSLIHK